VYVTLYYLQPLLQKKSVLKYDSEFVRRVEDFLLMTDNYYELRSKIFILSKLNKIKRILK